MCACDNVNFNNCLLRFVTLLLSRAYNTSDCRSFSEFLLIYFSTDVEMLKRNLRIKSIHKIKKCIKLCHVDKTFFSFYYKFPYFTLHICFRRSRLLSKKRIYNILPIIFHDKIHLFGFE